MTAVRIVQLVVVEDEIFVPKPRKPTVALFNEDGTPFVGGGGGATGPEGPEGPEGPAGAPGADAPPLVVLNWATATDYVLDDLVSHNGSIYKCTTAHTSAGAFDITKFTSVVNGGLTVLGHTSVNTVAPVNTNGTSAVKDIDGLSVDVTIGVNEVIVEFDLYAASTSAAVVSTFRIYDVTAAAVARNRIKTFPGAGHYDGITIRKRYAAGVLAPGARTFKAQMFSSGAPVISATRGDGGTSDSWIRVIG